MGPARAPFFLVGVPRRLLLLHPLPGQAGAHLHLDLARLGLRLLRQEDAQPAVAAPRRHVVHVDGRRQRATAPETPIGPLDAMISLLLVGVLELALAAQGERVAL